MAEQISREEWNRLYEAMTKGFTDINTRLDRQNGRLGEAEQELAVLKDRSDDVKLNRWIDRGVGTFIAAVLGVKEFWFR